MPHGNKGKNCEHLFALGVNVNGGFAEYSVAPENQCYKLNKDVPFDVAAMAEPLACAIHGIDRTDIIPGQTVLVIGGGAIGQLMIQLAKLEGASTVILSEPIEMRRKIGLSVGADAAVGTPSMKDLAQAIFQITGNEGTDCVIEQLWGTQRSHSRPSKWQVQAVL